MPNTEPIEILLVEDDPGDARLVQEALKESKVHNNLHHARRTMQITDGVTVKPPRGSLQVGGVP